MSVYVITEATVPANMLEEWKKFDAMSLPIMRKQKGFLGIQQFCSKDNTKFKGVIHWATEADHEACTQSPDFAPTFAGWQNLLENGVKFDFTVTHLRHSEGE